MKVAHAEYSKTRQALFSEDDAGYLANRKWDMSAGGVAGIRNPHAIKCLHAHAAGPIRSQIDA